MRLVIIGGLDKESPIWGWKIIGGIGTRYLMYTYDTGF
jgi:hypothetical protein